MRRESLSAVSRSAPSTSHITWTGNRASIILPRRTRKLGRIARVRKRSKPPYMFSASREAPFQRPGRGRRPGPVPSHGPKSRRMRFDTVTTGRSAWSRT